MQLASISDPRLWDPLCLIDEQEASGVRRAGCRHCGGALHSARYARRPRGVLGAVVCGGPGPALRHRFCCAECRRRTMPASVRFWGRRVYVGLLVPLLPVLLGDGSPTAVSAACRRLGLSRQTLRRWRHWWQGTFADSAFWRAQLGCLRPGVEVPGLPRGLLDGFPKGGWPGRAIRALSFLQEDFLLGVIEGSAAPDRNPQKMYNSGSAGADGKFLQGNGEAEAGNLTTPAGILRPGGASARGFLTGRRVRLRKRPVLFPPEG